MIISNCLITVVTVGFSQTTFEADEADGVVLLCVNLTATGQLQSPLEIQLLTGATATATAGDDFVSVSDTLIFTKEGVMCSSVPLLADNALEGDEVFEAFIIVSSDLTINITIASVEVVIVDSNRKFEHSAAIVSLSVAI